MTSNRPPAARPFLSRPESEAKQLPGAVRGHWGIESSLHWVLDIAFREDESRIRKGHAPEDSALTRHLALNILKQENSANVGPKAKRLKAGWDRDYLLTLLGASPTASI